ncbi:MFS transporter [Hymenobacter sp.]|uniref:MFS transporter n=1 Tax=Hymenobacter sp. TaxID=1898978 RepID=UPI00286CC159|nr:MFS transporter [Hymenobacter sp.]
MNQTSNHGSFPSLAENGFWRYFNFIALYFAEGLNMGMLFVGLPAWMAMKGKTPGEIGGFAFACALPWTFKFVVAPLMDRYTYLPMGRKRPWVLFGQIGLVASLVAMAYVPDPLNNLQLFMAAAFGVSAFGAIQDAATDGMAVDVIPEDEQARANGFMGGARMIGSSLALALGSWMLSTYSFTAAMLAVAAMIGFMTLVPIWLREQPGEKIAPWTVGTTSPAAKKLQATNWLAILQSLLNVFRLKNSLIISLLLFITMGAYNYFETLLPLFAVKISGWTNVFYGQAFATADLIGGIGGMLIGGYLIERFGKKRMISVYFALIILMVIALSVLKIYWSNTPFIYGFIIGYRWLNAFAKIGVYAIAMQCSSKKISASHFTFYMTIGAFGSMVGATLIGPIKDNFSWEITFFSFVGMIALAWLTMHFLNIDKQIEQLAELEDKESEKQVAQLVR